MRLCGIVKGGYQQGQKQRPVAVMVSHLLVFDDIVVDLLAPYTFSFLFTLSPFHHAFCRSKDGTGAVIRTFDTPVRVALQSPADVVAILNKAQAYKRKSAKVLTPQSSSFFLANSKSASMYRQS